MSSWERKRSLKREESRPPERWCGRPRWVGRTGLDGERIRGPLQGSVSYPVNPESMYQAPSDSVRVGLTVAP